MQNILFWFFLCLSAGIAGNARLDWGLEVCVSAGIVCLVMAAVFRSRWVLFVMFLIAAAVALGGYAHATAAHEIEGRAWERWVDSSADKRVVIEGTVCRQMKRYRKFYGGEGCGFVMADLRLWEDAGEARQLPEPLCGRVKVVFEGDAPVLRYGERLKVSGTFKLPAQATNPAEFDVRAFWRTRGCYAVLKARTHERLGFAGGGWRLLYAVKNRLIDAMDRQLGPERAGIAKAIFLGERAGLERDFKSALAGTGTMHLFAISGLHVAMVAGFLHIFLSLLQVPERPKAWFLAGFLIFYCVLTGANPPVVRATIMACAVLGARILWQKAGGLNLLGLAGAAILLMNPGELFDPGFRLSFTAVFGLVLFMPRFSSVRDLRDSRSDKWWLHARPYVKMTLIGSTVAWIVTAPLILGSFGRVCLAAPLVNFFLAPIVFLLNAVLLMFSAASLLPFSPEVLMVPLAAVLTDLLKMIVLFFDGSGQLLFRSSPWMFLTWALFWPALFWTGRTRAIKKRVVRAAAMTLLFLNALLLDRSIVMARPVPAVATFFDVGQGDSALFEFPGGGTLLIDAGRGGPFAAAERVLIPYLRSRGIRRIDAVIISHPQYDHCGGLEMLIDAFEVGLLLGNGMDSESAFYRRLTEVIKEKKIPHATVRRGDRLTGYPGTEIRILHPDPFRAGAGGSNNSSVAALVSCGTTDFLFTGDLEKEGLDMLQAALGRREIDVLKVPHHGAPMGEGGLRLLRRITPRVSVISVDAANNYGHPNAKTLKVLDYFSERVLRTDRGGAICIRMPSGGPFAVLEPQKKQ